MTHACELILGLMWSVSDFTCVLAFLQQRQDICNRHGWTHTITSVSIFILYGLASRAWRGALIIERDGTPSTTWTRCCQQKYCSRNTAEVVVEIYTLWTDIARFKVVHLLWCVCTCALWSLEPFLFLSKLQWTRTVIWLDIWLDTHYYYDCVVEQTYVVALLSASGCGWYRLSQLHVSS